MSDVNNVDQSDDLEMLAAIKAAFGEEALGMLSDDIELDTGEDLANQQNLDELVQDIDNATLANTNLKEVEASSSTVDEADKHIVVQVSGRTFGIPMANIHEIQRVPKVTFLPGVPDWILGVTNLRGNVVSVVDLQQLLQLPETDAPSISKRLVMSHSLVDDIATGLVVDRVIGIRNVSKNKMLKPTAPVDDQVANFLSGMIELEEHLVALLDVDKLLLSKSSDNSTLLNGVSPRNNTYLLHYQIGNPPKVSQWHQKTNSAAVLFPQSRPKFETNWYLRFSPLR